MSMPAELPSAAHTGALQLPEAEAGPEAGPGPALAALAALAALPALAALAALSALAALAEPHLHLAALSAEPTAESRRE
jgi:hypothetical protein